MTTTFKYKGVIPTIDLTAFIAPTANIIGDVVIGKNSSVWFNTVIRADGNPIRIGHETNIQDLSVIHISRAKTCVTLGDRISVGHRVILHGCVIEDDCLIGMGSCLMDHVVVGRESLIGAGALVTEKTVVPPRTLMLGAPAKPIRQLTDEEVEAIKKNAAEYVAYASAYRKG